MPDTDGHATGKTRVVVGSEEEEMSVKVSWDDERTEAEYIAYEEEWAKQVAALPVDDPQWRSSSGEEYFFTAGRHYAVINGRLGKRRERFICRIEDSVVVGGEGDE